MPLPLPCKQHVSCIFPVVWVGRVSSRQLHSVFQGNGMAAGNIDLPTMFLTAEKKKEEIIDLGVP